MIKHLSKITSVAAFAVIASSASAEIKLNENFSVEGYAIGSAVVTEPSSGVKDKVLLDNSRNYDSAKIALNGKFDAFTSKVSGYLINGDNNKDNNGIAPQNFGLLDAYVSYTQGEFVVTGGKYIGWLGYESFDSPNNDFITNSMPNSVGYASPYATGAKVEYITKAYSTGVSVRDSQTETVPANKFFKGDGNFGDDLGYEAYFLYTGVDKLKVFAGMGYESIDGYADNGGHESVSTYDVWTSYDVTSKLTLVAEYASYEDTVSYSWNTMAKYAFTNDFSGAVRVTGGEYAAVNTTAAGEVFGYGVASTYTLSKNFALKAEVTKTEYNAVVNGSNADVFSYALQGVLKF
jgi:hypothetical protein